MHSFILILGKEFGRCESKIQCRMFRLKKKIYSLLDLPLSILLKVLKELF